jgi:hypothetical protein
MVELLLTVLFRRLRYYTIRNVNILCLHNTNNYIFKDKIYNGLNSNHQFLDSLILTLKNKGDIISYEQLDDAISSKETSFLLTFDDGYYSNLTFSKIFAEKTNKKIHIFPTINYVNGSSYPWWILLWNLIENNNEIFIFNVTYNAVNYQQKRKLYKYLHALFLKESQENISSFINKYMFYVDENYSFLNKSDIVFLSENKYATFGLHTSNHENLQNFKDNELNSDILSNLKFFNNLGIDINSFAIPFGLYNRSKRSELFRTMENNDIKNIFSTNPLENISNEQIRILGRLSI